MAIVGMMAAHLMGFPHGASLGSTLTSGFPSTLFAVLGGFGVIFAARRYQRADQNLAAFVAIISRGIVVLLLGLLMELLPENPIAVILVYFGVAIICAAFLLRVPSIILALLAAVLAVGGPLLIEIVRQADPDYGSLGRLDLGSFTDATLSVFFRGTYPVLTWIVYLLIGMILARLVLRARQEGRLAGVSLWMFAVGAATCVVTWLIDAWYRGAVFVPYMVARYDVTPERVLEWLDESRYGALGQGGWAALPLTIPHTGLTFDILRTAGAAVALIGLCLWATYRLRAVPLVLRPIAAAGAAPLTIYTFHLVATSLSRLFTYGAEPWWVHGAGAMAWQLACVLAIGTALSALGSRGPLEFFTSQISQWCAGRVSDQPQITQPVDGGQ